MGTEATWAARVAGWKSSGLTSREYCEGKPFTDGGLRHWAYRLRQTKARRPKHLSVRVARVVRVAASPRPAREPPAFGACGAQGEDGRGVEAPKELLVVECGGMRVVVRAGFDGETLARILGVLAAQRVAR